MALQQATQEALLTQKQQQLAASAALQPVMEPSFGQTDTALARQQDLLTVAECIIALAAQHLTAPPAAASISVQHAFISMFSAASLPRLASQSPHDRAEQLRHLADICLGK